MLILFVLFLFLALNSVLHGVIDSMLVTNARRVLNDAVNSAVQSAADRGGTSDGFVILSYDSGGGIASIETDPIAVNEFRAALSSAVSENLKECEENCLSIPLGSLTGFDIFTGRGPDIELRLIQQGSIATDVVSSFTAAGINQTCHRIDCTVNGMFFAVIPGFRSPVELDTSVMVAQSVIVGEVPDSYTNVNGDQNDTIGRIFDYGDPYGEDAADLNE